MTLNDIFHTGIHLEMAEPTYSGDTLLPLYLPQVVWGYLFPLFLDPENNFSFSKNKQTTTKKMENLSQVQHNLRKDVFLWKMA